MRARQVSLLVLCIVVWTTDARAQVGNLNIVTQSTFAVPNYNRVGLGQREMLEAGAFLARTDDGGAVWYNPAGLVRAENSVLNASANAYDWTTFTLEGSNASRTSGSFTANASLIAGVIASPVIESRNWRLGFASARPVNWQPGQADFAVLRSGPALTDRFSLLSDVSFSQLFPAAGVAWMPKPGLRLGASLALWWTSISHTFVLQQSRLDATPPAQLSTLTRNYAVSGSVAHGTIAGGMQWDLGERWTLGATFRTPGLRVWGSSLVRYDAQLAIGADQASLGFRDEEADIDYRIPTHAALGLARTFARGAIEVDVRYYGSTPEYSMISSGATGTLIVDTQANPATSSVVGLEDIRHEAAQVVGFAVGGRYDLKPSLVLHLGAFSDPSPVANPERSYFRQIDIFGVTSGLELKGEHFSGSFGFGYNWGDSGPVSTGGLIGGEAISTNLKISTLSLTYAVSFRF